VGQSTSYWYTMVVMEARKYRPRPHVPGLRRCWYNLPSTELIACLRKISGGPTLDWSIIQPLFLGANADVAIFLDCCYAGQAMRSRASRMVEFLTATDKDQYTPIGHGKWPSFTKALIRELRQMKPGTNLTIRELHNRLIKAETGLAKQPFYASLSEDSHFGSIALRIWEKLESVSEVVKFAIPPQSPKEVSSLYLRLSTSGPLDDRTRETLVTWMTRDSPSAIADLQLIDHALSNAESLNDLGSEIVETSESSNRLLKTFISKNVRKEGEALLNALRDAISITDVDRDLDPVDIIDNINQKSDQFLTFLSGNLTQFDKHSLQILKAKNTANEELASRISMRLAILEDNVSLKECTVSFEDRPLPEQHLRLGKIGNASVLVEYWYHDEVDADGYTRFQTQLARTSALLSEPKSPAFRIFPSEGYLHESLHGPRFGLIYRLPDALGLRKFIPLSELFSKVRVFPLDLRLRLSRVISNALLQLHSIGWLHKGIRSDRILVFVKGADSDNEASYTTYDFENPYLIGFDSCRPTDRETLSSVDFNFAANLYRHPERWGRPTVSFQRYHDIFALVSFEVDNHGK
jgi:hypothetical protein